jgi:hypothetical protein
MWNLKKIINNNNFHYSVLEIDNAHIGLDAYTGYISTAVFAFYRLARYALATSLAAWSIPDSAMVSAIAMCSSRIVGAQTRKVRLISLVEWVSRPIAIPRPVRFEKLSLLLFGSMRLIEYAPDAPIEPLGPLEV